MQARQRRAAAVYGVFAAVAVAAAGLPVSLVVTPLLFLFFLVSLRLSAVSGSEHASGVQLAQHLDATLRAALHSAFEGRMTGIDAETTALLFVPGAAVMCILWIAVRRRLAQSGAGGSIVLQAREPAPGDFEERQIENVVGEMAVAAGITPPPVRLLDSASANAAAIGTRHDNATIVVTRGLLDRLDREETQALVGHLVASVGNDDLKVAALLLSIQQTLGLLTTILNVPFGPLSRRTLRRFVWPRTIEERLAVADVLTTAGMNTDDDLSRYVTRLGGAGWPLRVLPRLVLFPFFFVAVSSRMSATLVTGGLFGWIFAALWRRRRRMADAMAVQLTRNPDALARGLGALIDGEHRVRGAEGAAHLFAAWQPDPSGQHPLPLVFGGVGTLAPSIAKRREALRRMGAASVVKARRMWTWSDLFMGPSGTLLVLFPAIVLIGGAAALLTLAVMIAFNFLFLALLLIGVDWVVQFLVPLMP
jgi:Zn-dependent protease with chaperone function